MTWGENAITKRSGGAVSLIDNRPTLRRRMVAGSKVARMIAEFEDDTTRSHKKDSEHHHHEQQPGSRSPSNICERCRVVIRSG